MSLSNLEKSFVEIEGHITIWDPDTGEVMVKRRNAVHYENMSMSIAGLLANQSGVIGNYQIRGMRFGNGGTVIDGLGNVTYKSPNTTGSASALYNETLSQVVDEVDADAGTNTVVAVHTNGNIYSDVITTCTLDYLSDDYADQDLTDTATNMDGDYVFDELSIYNANDDLLTHVIFHPVQKSANRKIQVIYTLRIRTSYSDII
jgi:hypothetical protein